MSTPKTEVTKELPIIKGSTAQIMEGLYRMLMDVPKEMSSDNEALKRVIRSDAKTAQLQNQFSADATHVATESTVLLDRAIDKMPKGNKLADAFKQKINVLTQDLDKLKSRETEVLNEFRKFVLEQREEISEHIIHNPNLTKADLKYLDANEEKLKRFETTFKQIEKAQTDLLMSANNLNDQLPQNVRTELPSREIRKGPELST